MKQLEIWEADDGTRFDDQEDCIDYENAELKIAIARRLGINYKDPQELRPIRYFMFKVQKAVQMGAIYLHSPNATPPSSYSKWLPQEETRLLEAYQLWLQHQGLLHQRTPNAMHVRIQQALKRLRLHGMHFKA